MKLLGNQYLVLQLGSSSLSGIKIFNHLPTRIKCVANEIQVFKMTLKRFHLSDSFYSIEGYFNSDIQYIFQIVMF